MTKLLDRYEEVVGPQEIRRLRQLADKLAGKRILHINSTRVGGGVAEILDWMIPLLEELGIQAAWEVIRGNPEFYQVTKTFHNGLQGFPVTLKKADFDLHYEVNQENAKRLDLQADVVFVHDPQPVYLPRFTPPGRVGRWVWRCHIDASHPARSVWKYIESALTDYQATVFSMPAFARPLHIPAFIIPPAIDPLSPKNCALSEAERLEILARFGIDPERPLLLQVSRFDRFKDPLGVIEAYRLVKPYYPEAQLVLVGGPADDDPEGAEVLREVLAAVDEDRDLKVLLLPPDSHREINALQRSATIVLQKSLREGFGLTVTEALWKGKPVIGGACGGITLQVHDYHTGFLVYSPAGAAYRIRYLMRYTEKRQRMGNLGRQFVREHFLLTRHLRDYLTLLVCLDQPGDGQVVV
ncbi:MAG TPA: glycosyl transferase family 1 [Deltaproteobacteria bacterium]|nr:glycosyl transferase family 1 [Deltaproteobacteria bacterium]